VNLLSPLALDFSASRALHHRLAGHRTLAAEAERAARRTFRREQAVLF